jgi:hypothetical protein
LPVSFPAGAPDSPEGYLKMLVEHLSAVEDLSDIGLESTCREIVETHSPAGGVGSARDRREAQQYLVAAPTESKLSDRKLNPLPPDPDHHQLSAMARHRNARVSVWTLH